MKLINKLLAILLVALLIYSCDDNPTEPEEYSTGSADFTTFVTIGNSLTAGYQSGALYESSQVYSYGKLIARQVGNVKFEQPIVSDPGTGGRMEFKGIVNGVPIIEVNENSGQPTNIISESYNNLGVPGAVLADALYAENSSTSASPNPMFDLILAGKGTQLQQMAKLNPTFVIFWLGNNDILGYATQGGLAPFTPVEVFETLYSNAMDSIAATGADAVVANIPDVATAPFFTTAGPMIADQLAGTPAVGIYYNKSREFGAVPETQFASPTDLVNFSVTLNLTAFEVLENLGEPYDFYSEIGMPVPAGIDVSQPFALHPQNPLPDVFLLDADELAIVDNIVTSYNAIIKAKAEAKGFGVVDVNAYLKDLAQNTKVVNNIRFSSEYISGLAFSLDGVHPSTQGYGLVANEFIRVINSKYDANIPYVDLSKLPSILTPGKIGLMKAGLAPVAKGTFDNILF